MDRLEFSAKLARDAGRLAHTAFGQSATSMKGRHDVLTAMDGEVERFIRKAIVARYPDDAIIGEEEGGRAGDRVWLIDPIDGMECRRSRRCTTPVTTGSIPPRGAKAPFAMARRSR